MGLGNSDERLGVFVMHSDVLLDGAGQFRDGAKHAVAQGAGSTTSNVALSDASNRATVLLLNACPYRAITFFHRRPRVVDSIEATTILTQGALDRPGCVQVVGVNRIYRTRIGRDELHRIGHHHDLTLVLENVDWRLPYRL